MKISYWKLGFLLAPIVLVSACSPKKSDSSFRQGNSLLRQGEFPFEGLWASAEAITDYRNSNNGRDQINFCKAVFNHPIAHGYDPNCNCSPGLHPLAIRIDGEVSNYDPAIVRSATNLKTLNPSRIGAVDKGGNYVPGAVPAELNNRARNNRIYGFTRIAAAKMSIDPNGILNIHEYESKNNYYYTRTDDDTLIDYANKLNQCLTSQNAGVTSIPRPGFYPNAAVQLRPQNYRDGGYSNDDGGYDPRDPNQEYDYDNRLPQK